ncbi:PQQ-dependent sugar dehydrogenase [Haloarchaeobius amylolyticus]|uniref:PQQ-dependent sugar dehydrogenase n=1 Tax=Haloarchaeobius amylolyticus TaxID=1198296 RepID=UPI0022712709|nr:PQQ-dependent sugar dehydrogenase [Haloarchaeobius amylolyticus]
MRRRRFLAATATLPTVAGAGCLGPDDDERTHTTTEERPLRLERVRMRLDTPWGAAFHPRTGELYVTERPGRIQQATGRDAGLVRDLTVETVERGETGLHGLAFDPADPTRAFAFQTYQRASGLWNRVLELAVDRAFAVSGVLFDRIPAAEVNNGGRLAIGPEDALYVTTGDVGEPERARDTDSLAGKVLRLTRDGDPHPDNPFDNAVYSYGFRNPLGITFVDGECYVCDHGPDANDELNRVEPGGDYGWPAVAGPAQSSQSVDPLVTWDARISPASLAYYRGGIERWQDSFFVGALTGEHLRRVVIDGGEPVSQGSFFGDLGRIRTTFTGPDGHLYLTTSDQDGQGDPEPTDDAVFRVLPP